ncbi:hypothetical protein BHE74_00043676 [Ensete ventricosum]|nr:hypothetical protein BHE74_00043676 [Ensete ventricosum]
MVRSKPGIIITITTGLRDCLHHSTSLYHVRWSSSPEYHNLVDDDEETAAACGPRHEKDCSEFTAYHNPAEKNGDSRVLYTHATAATRVRRITQRRVRRLRGLYSNTTHLICVAQQHSLGLSAASYRPHLLSRLRHFAYAYVKVRGLGFLSFVCTANVELIHLPLLGTKVQYMVVSNHRLRRTYVGKMLWDMSEKLSIVCEPTSDVDGSIPSHVLSFHLWEM